MPPQKTRHHVLHTNLQMFAKPKAEQNQEVSLEDLKHSPPLWASPQHEEC